MILPDCRIIYHENEHSNFSGIDCKQYCQDLQHFENYPYPVSYSYNSRGFRGPEWPSDLTQAIWCVGDSFTAGLGAPENHTWWYQLSLITGRPCINVSMDGASNSWISRWAQKIIADADAQTVVVHWSFTHRRERPLKTVVDEIWQDYYTAIKSAEWPDCASRDDTDLLPEAVQNALAQDPRFDCYTQGFDLESLRRVQETKTTVEQDVEYTLAQLQALENNKQNCTVIHSHIPHWHATDLKFDLGQWIEEFDQIDFARDGFHYDIKTTKLFVDRISKVLKV